MKKKILNALKIGYNNKKSKQELMIKTGLSDRSIRQGIEELRANGYMIISSSKFNGYYIANEDDTVDVKKMRLELMSRIKHLKTSVDCCNKFLNNYK